MPGEVHLLAASSRYLSGYLGLAVSGALRGTRALVVGAGSGIGRAIAVAFANEGARLGLSGRNIQRLRTTRAACADAPALVVEASDVSRPDDVGRLVDRVEKTLGGIDVAVNAAGVHGAIGAVQDCDPSEWLRAIEVNLYGSFLLSRAVLPGMLRQRSGRIILFSGGGATSPMPRFSAYASSKAGVVRLMETLAEELRPHVQVNAIAPGMVDTPLLDSVLAAGPRAGAEYGQVREVRNGDRAPVPCSLVAELAVFLASEASTSLTGRLISAPHDPWRDWVENAVPQDGLYTLRRLDPHTVKPLLESPA